MIFYKGIRLPGIRAWVVRNSEKPLLLAIGLGQLAPSGLPLVLLIGADLATLVHITTSGRQV